MLHLNPRSFRVLRVAIAALIGFSLPAAGRDKIDIVTLHNGDRITGEIKSLEGGELELSTDAMDTISIEWPEIAGIQSGYHYEVRLSDGERLYGSFNDKAQRAGQMIVVDPFGRHELELLSVVEIRPIEDTVVERIDIYLSATFSYTKATSIGQATANTAISYEDEKSSNNFKARSDISRTEEDETSSTNISFTRNTWTENRSNVFRSLFASYESNDELALTRRIGVGAGLGRYFLDTHSNTLTGSTGLQVVFENNDDSDTGEDLELFVSSTYSMWKFSSPEMDLVLGVDLYPGLTEFGRFRSSTNLRLRWEIVEDLYWDVTAWATTDNESATGSTTDYAITTGIGWNN